MSPKKCPQKVTQKEDISWTFLSTRCQQKCPRDVTPFVHEMSPIMSTKCLPPEKIRVPDFFSGSQTDPGFQNKNSGCSRLTGQISAKKGLFCPVIFLDFRTLRQCVPIMTFCTISYVSFLKVIDGYIRSLYISRG